MFIKTELLRRNPNLNHLIKPSFPGINRLFSLAYENDTQRTSAKVYYYIININIE